MSQVGSWVLSTQSCDEPFLLTILIEGCLKRKIVIFLQLCTSVIQPFHYGPIFFFGYPQNRDPAPPATCTQHTARGAGAEGGGGTEEPRGQKDHGHTEDGETTATTTTVTTRHSSGLNLSSRTDRRRCSSSWPDTHSIMTSNGKAKTMIGNIFSLSTLSTGVAVFYVYFAFNNLAKLMNPLAQFAAEELRQMPQDQMVNPFWGGDDAAGTLGLRVYLSTERDFHLEFLSDAEFGEQAETESGFKSVLDQQRSFLLWSEDNAVDSTTQFPARSFVLVASDEMQPPATSSSCTLSGEECSASQAQTSIEYAHKWIQDSIQHERQLASDGGGLMAAMNSAGGGIESTSVLLAFYTSLTRSVKTIFERVLGLISADESSSDAGPSGSTADAEEPLTIINLSPKNPLWRNLMSNGTAYVHVVLARQFPYADEPHMLSASPDARSARRKLQKIHAHHNLLLDQVGMIKRELPTHVPPPRRLLYRDFVFVARKYTLCLVREVDSCKLSPPWDIEHHQSVANSDYQMAKSQRKEGIVVPYWKPEVHIHLIKDSESYPMQVANRVGFEIIQVGQGDARHRSGYAYLPAAHVDEIGLTSEKYIPLNETVMALPLRIGFHGGGNSDSPEEQEGITPARYRLLNHLANALESQKEMGFEESDIDDLRRLIAETNVKLLAVTIFASVFHLLFEFLTFKSDVQVGAGVDFELLSNSLTFECRNPQLPVLEG